MEEETMIMAALSSLNHAHLTASLLSDTHRRRIAAILSSPTLFSLTLNRLHSLSLPHKSFLIARHLLSSLRLLTRHLLPTPPPPSATPLRDLDAVLLLLLLCELRHHHPHALRPPTSSWRAALAAYSLEKSLTVSGLAGAHGGAVLDPYVEAVVRCRRFVRAAGGLKAGENENVAASPAAVVALPSAEVAAAAECAICKEEMTEGIDACELPCQHLFHWACVLVWLRERNTCPCCRFELPTDDVYADIERLWGVLVKMSGCSARTGLGCRDGDCI